MMFNVLRSIVIVTTCELEEILGYKSRLSLVGTQLEKSFTGLSYQGCVNFEISSDVAHSAVQIRVVAACKWLTCGVRVWGRSFVVSGQAQRYIYQAKRSI